MTKGTNLGVDMQAMPLRNPKGNFVQISNAILLDERLSFKARGILTLLLSRPKDWKIHINEIVNQSVKDGKRAIQTGFKELLDLKYLKLISVYNELTRKFEGTTYQLNESIFLPREAHFRTVEKTDRPKTSSSENQTVQKTDRPKTASHNKTENRNTKYRNTKKEKHQQQKEGNTNSDVVDAFLKISFFMKQLSADKSWQELFIGQSLSSNVELNEQAFKLLLQHFEKTSLQNDTTYPNIAAAKKHFANWFKANLEKKALLKYIQAFKKQESDARKQIKEMTSKTDRYFDAVLQQECTSIEQVIDFQKRLLHHQAFYKKKAILLQNEKEQAAIGILLSDIEKLVEKINQSKKTNQLAYFCKKSVSKKSKPSQSRIADMDQQFSNLQNKLSCSK